MYVMIQPRSTAPIFYILRVCSILHEDLPGFHGVYRSSSSVLPTLHPILFASERYSRFVNLSAPILVLALFELPEASDVRRLLTHTS